MGKRRKTKQFQIKNIISLKDKRRDKPAEIKKPEKQKDPDVKYYEKPQFHLYFLHNTSLGPPYHILLDTNFINFSIKNKLDIFKASMDCLLGKVIPCLTDCVLAELEKLGIRYRMALKISKDPRFMRLSCSHKGTYADDCLVRRVTTHRCFIVATCDKDLKRRLRKVPGVPIMYISNHKYTIERMPEALGAPRT